MYDTPAVSLVTTPTAALSIARVEPGGDAAVMCGFAFTSMLSVVLFLAGMPLISMGVLAITGVSTIVLESALATRRRRHGARVEDLESPEVIVALETRDAYRGILSAYGEIRRALSDASAMRAVQPAVLGRCEAAVRQCGRLAVLSNPLQRYLDAHDRKQTRADLDRLRERSEATTDESTVDALGRAAAARTRQLETHDQIVKMRERIQARLELVRAALESFSATIVKLRVAGEEQMILSGDSVMDHLEGVDDELELLEAELAIDLAA
jgi:uncharacterized membrane protein (Fun14 family)